MKYVNMQRKETQTEIGAWPDICLDPCSVGYALRGVESGVFVLGLGLGHEMILVYLYRFPGGHKSPSPVFI